MIEVTKTMHQPEALPDLSDQYVIPPGKIDRFRHDGHVLLRGVASSGEAEAYRRVIAAEVERRKEVARGGIYKTPLHERSTRDRAFLQMENLWPDHPDIARFSLSRRFARIAAELLGMDGIRIYHDQALFKEPGGGYTPWHQDQFYWPLDTNHTVTMWMPLVPTGAEMGTMVFASGLHREGPLATVVISDQSEDVYKSILKERDVSLVIGELDAGDTTWHYGWTPHKTPGNVTDRMRQVMTIIYFADGTKVLEPQNEKHPNDMAKWLPGCQPGESAASPINPVVWRKEESRVIP